jgi:hypothetical protein
MFINTSRKTYLYYVAVEGDLVYNIDPLNVYPAAEWPVVSEHVQRSALHSNTY